VAVLYDHRYAEAGWMLQVLSAALLVAPFAVAAQAYLAIGMPQLHSRILAIRLCGLVIGLPIGFHFFGLRGALWGAVLSQFPTLPMFILYNVKSGLFGLRREMARLFAALVGMGVGTVIASWLTSVLQ
jgi:hypothetical protein